MQYPFAAMVVISDIQEILASFHSGSGISAALFDLDEQVIAASPVRDSWDEPKSKISQVRQSCRPLDTKIFPYINGKPVRRCTLPGGYLNYICSIFVENEDVANLSLGPVFHTQPNESSFRLLAQESSLDEAAHLKDVQEVPIVTEEQIVSYLELLAVFVQRLAEKGHNELCLVETNAAAQVQLQKQENDCQKLEKRLQERTEELDRTNAALQESEQRFQVALVDTPVVVFNQDLDLRYTWIYNPQNYADPPIVGKTDADLFAPDDAGRLTALKRKVIESGVLTREEVSLTVGEQVLFYDMTFNPLFDANGAITGLTCAATNITERRQTEKDIRRRLAESEGIQRIAKGLLLKIGLDEVLEIVCTEAMQLTNAKGSAVLLLDDEGWLRLTHRAGLPIYTLDRLPVEGSLAGQAIQTRSPVWANRQKGESTEGIDQWQGYPWTPGLISMLSVPLQVETQTIGVLNILDKPGEITQEDMRIIDLFADQAAIIIEHVRLQHQAEQFAVLEERQHLARELHDSVTQALYSVTLYADAGLLAFSRKQWGALERNLNEVRTMAREAMYDMRLLVFELRPLELEKEGLSSALRARLAAVESRTGLKTEVLAEGERRLQPGVEELIYRIAQESLNNVVKHAKASHVQIRLKYDEDVVRLEVIDDGLGFDPENARQRGGVGLQGIQERVQKSRGHLEIESAPGKGTRLTVTIPLNSSDQKEIVEESGRQ